jgi:hypothetical protein
MIRPIYAIISDSPSGMALRSVISLCLKKGCWRPLDQPFEAKCLAAGSLCITDQNLPDAVVSALLSLAIPVIGPTRKGSLVLRVFCSPQNFLRSRYDLTLRYACSEAHELKKPDGTISCDGLRRLHAEFIVPLVQIGYPISRQEEIIRFAIRDAVEQNDISYPRAALKGLHKVLSPILTNAERRDT